jgi:hypothetical protein
MINVVTQAQDDEEAHKDYELLVAHAVLLTVKPRWRAASWFLIVPAVTYIDDALLYMRQFGPG